MGQRSTVQEVSTETFTRRLFPGLTCTLGSAPACDVRLGDGGASSHHLALSLHAGRVRLDPAARTYLLLGQGGSGTIAHALAPNDIIKMGACSLKVASTVRHEDAASAPFPVDKAEDGSTCYICFDTHSSEDNALIHSPCACRTAVHQECMSKWIATMGTRVCSICRTKLPIAFAAQAPYIVLQVVRHMRGLHWSGEREYIVSFDGGGQAPGWMAGGAESVVVGSGSECHLSLPDPSLSRRHACISYDGRSFQLEDLSSSAGTFVRLETAVCLLPQSPSTFKIGRTTLTVEVVQGGHGLEVALPSIGSPAAAAATSQASSPAPSWWESRGRSSAVSPASPTPPVFPMEAVSTLHDDTRQADGAPHLQDTAPNAVTSDTALPDHTQPHAAAGGSH